MRNMLAFRRALMLLLQAGSPLREAHQATRETTQEGLREVQPARLTQLREVQAGSSQAHHSTKMRRRTKPDLGGFSPVVPLKVVGFA